MSLSYQAKLSALVLCTTVFFANFVYSESIDLFIGQKHHATVSLTTTGKEQCLHISKVWEPSQLIDDLIDLGRLESCMTLELIEQKFNYKHVLFEDFHSLYLIQQKEDKIEEPIVFDFGNLGAFLNYDITYTQEKKNEMALFFTDEKLYDRYTHVKVENGINFHDFAFRTSLVKDEEDRWYMAESSLMTVFPEQNMRLVIGDEFSFGRFFDPSNRRGISLQTEDRLLMNQQTVLPVVQGVANTDAEVSIMQGQTLILRRRVEAGVFRFNDIILPNGNTSIFLVIRETNGMTKTTLITPPQLPTVISKDQFWFEAFLGETLTDPLFDFLELPTIPYGQVSGIYGASDYLSFYGGTQLAEFYQSYQAGLGINMHHLGMLSFDLTQADYRIANEPIHYNGQHAKLNYTQVFLDSKLTFTHTSDFYFSEHFLTLSDYQSYTSPMSLLFESHKNMASNTEYGFSSRLEYLGQNANLFLEHNNQISHDNKKNQMYTLNSSYFGWDNINLNASLTYYKTDYFEDYSANIGLSYSFPQNITSSVRTTVAKSQNKNQIELYGTMDNDIDYSLNWVDIDSQYGGTLTSKHHFGETFISYNKNKNAYMSEISTSGALAFHPKGVTFGEKINEQYAVLCLTSPNESIRLLQTSNRQTDAKGCFLVSNLGAYQENTLFINSEIFAGSGDNDISDKVLNLSPTERAFLFRNIE